MYKKYNFNRNCVTRYCTEGSPCGQGQDCPERSMRCHSTCEKYLTWKSKREKRKAAWQKEKAKELAFGERYVEKLKRLGVDGNGKPVNRR